MRNLFPYILLSSLWLPGAAQAQTLNILTWEAYFSEELISAWEARTGATVNEIVFDRDEVRNTMLGTVRPGTLDLVTIDKVSAPLFGERGILVPVAQFSDTDNLRHLAPRWVQSCGSFSTPYLWGTMGLVYRRDILPQAPDSWHALLQPEASLIGHLGLLDNYIDTLAPSLILREASISTEDEALLSDVYDELRDLLPSLLTFDYALTFVGQHPQADSLHLALAYSGDERELNRLSGTDDWAYAVPKEGTSMWVDCLAVVANSSNQALAMDFLNFINIPAVAAANSETLGIATPNTAAVALQPEAFRNNPLVYPDVVTGQTFQEYEAITLNNILMRNRITSALVKLHESQ